MRLLRHQKAGRAEQGVSQAIRDLGLPESELFTFAHSDPELAEKIGYSQYSYWGSTLAVFLKNRGAVALLITLLILVTFTFLQPLLPGQYEATRIINHPVTGMQLSNVPPSLTSAMITASEGTELIITPWENGEWAAVSNVLSTIKARTDFTITRYMGDWCEVSFNGQTGYVRNDFTTKLKLPEDPEAVPYPSRANFSVRLHTDPQDLTNRGDELFVKKQSLDIAADGISARLKEKAELRILPTQASFLFGTNIAGQDLWSMVWSGTRTSLFIGLAGVAISLFLGVLLGGISGLYGGWIDTFIQRLIEILRSIRTIPLWMCLAAAVPPPWSVLQVYIAMTVIISLIGWTELARVVRGRFLSLREEDFVTAAELAGASQMRIIFRHMVPSFLSHIIAAISLALPAMIISETTLSFLGLGLRPPAISWGVLLQDAQNIQDLAIAPWLLVAALPVIVVILAFNFLGDGLRDAADPYS